MGRAESAFDVRLSIGERHRSFDGFNSGGGFGRPFCFPKIHLSISSAIVLTSATPENSAPGAEIT
jgi:hypothetical protein